MLTKIFTALTKFLDAVDDVVSGSAQDTAEAAAAQPTANIWTTLLSFIPFVLVIVAFYFFLIRPQRKQEKETQKMRNSIEIGDQITTIGGITGVVRQIKDCYPWWILHRKSKYVFRRGRVWNTRRRNCAPDRGVFHNLHCTYTSPFLVYEDKYREYI